MTSVKLPFHLEAPTVAMMMPGETLYTTPWAMVVDNKDRTCWLRGGYAVFDSQRGTVTMEIHRNGHGFDVKLNDGYRFTLQPISATRREEWDLRPVNKLKW